MRISKFIKQLEEIHIELGDVEVFQQATNTTMGCITPARLPRVKEIARLKGREHNQRYVLSDDEGWRHTNQLIVYVGR